MKKKIVWLLCSALLLTILSACGGNDDAPKGRGNNVPTSVSSAVTAPVRSTTLAVTVANVSGYNFQELYVSPTGTNNWGEDHLGSTSILKNNGSYDITLARYDFENYDVLIIDEDGDEYEFKYVPLVDGCEMQIGFDENGVPGVVVVGADGTENYVSGTLNGSSGATGGGETVVVQEQQQTVTGTGYDTNGQFVFEVYNNSAYDIYALYIGVINASSDHDIDVLPQILPANSSTTIVGQATMGDWSQTEWTLYVEDVDSDTSASFDSFNPWTVSYVDIYWQGDSYVCDFTY